MGGVLAAVRRYRVMINKLGLRHAWMITDRAGNKLKLSDVTIKGVTVSKGDKPITVAGLGLKRAIIN